MNQFPQIRVEGGPAQRGRQHGEQLKSAIHETVQFYRSIFGMPDSEILELAEYFQGLIQAFNGHYLAEINAIAEGAEVDPRWIVALNARTEILSHKADISCNECTAIHFTQQSILGQNWDWGKALEPLTVCMIVTQSSGQVIRMITEPGIIGKIGMNSAGIGVCLNILTSGRQLKGLPVHILLRALLDCQSLQQAQQLLESHSAGKASNIVVADGNGGGFDIEFYDDRYFLLKPENGYLLHTNHYLAEEINLPSNPDFASSYARFNRAKFLLENDNMRTLQSMCAILSDDSDTELPIYRDYVPDDAVQEVGTVCSIVMDLAGQKMLIRKGKGEDADFIEYEIE